jgi:hypothetical protein
MNTTAFRADFPAAFAERDEIERDRNTRLQGLQLTERPLSIGIIGQVKAGKSSFLNALLFDGEPVLPKAATPKTANLTRLRHGKTPSLTVRFYDKEAWDSLETLAQSPRRDDAAKAARELIRHAREKNTPIAEAQAMGTHTQTLDSVAALQATLNDYVGEDGRYTPVVAATEIHWPHPALEGLEIVDTPGVNDPIHSRVQKTRDYLADCDMVFLLSRTSHFLDEHDLGLFAQQAPAKGVRRLVLVGTQLDNAILDDGFDRDSLAETQANVRRRLLRHAERSLLPQVERLRAEGRTELADRLAQAAHAPLLMSSFAKAFACKPPADWAEDERHVFGCLEELAKDVWDEPLPDREGFEALAGFAPLQDVLAKARSEKEAILAEQRALVEPEYRQRLADWAGQTLALVRERMAILERQSLSELDAREAALTTHIGRIATALSAHVTEAVQAVRTRSHVLEGELREAAARAAKLETHTRYETRRESVRVSDSKWYKPWTWGSSHQESYSVTESYRCLAVSEAIDQTVGYVRQAQAQLSSEIEALASPERLSARLRQVLWDAVDTGDARFDPLALRAQVAQTLSGLVWPRWDFALKNDPTARIVSRFGTSGEVRAESAMAELRQIHDALIAELNEALAQALETRVAQLTAQLTHMGASLEERLTRALQTDLAQLREALRDATATHERYAAFAQTLEHSR